jgi:hypothetical protein
VRGNDLALTYRPRVVYVLEGVLCSVERSAPRRTIRNLRPKPKVVLKWSELAVKRLIYLTRFHAASHEIVTFTSQELADEAAEFFLGLQAPVTTVEYVEDFDNWTFALRFQTIQAVYDSDSNRLDRYGQVGRAVIWGGDFA